MLQNNTYKLSFKAGLTKRILFQNFLISTKKNEEEFLKKYGTEADFKSNKTVAYANKSCCNLFSELLHKLNKNILFPPCIKVYEKKELIEKDCANNFCIPDTKSVLNDDYPFPGRSIFFYNYKSLEDIDNIVEKQFKNKKTSSPHFLAPFIHEWVHSLHLDYIYSKYGYGGTCKFMHQQYPTKYSKVNGFDIIKNLADKQLTEKENEIIFEELGEYSTRPVNQYFEIFSEAVTKYICESLSGVKLIKNPIDLFKNSSKEFQNIFKKVSKLDINE